MTGCTQNRYTLYLKIEDEELKSHAAYSTPERTLSNENAGFDLITAEPFSGDGPHLLNLGVRAMLVQADSNEPNGHPVHFWLAPRSSIYKTGYIMANSLGIIDSSYRGVLKAPVVRLAGAAIPGTGGFQRGDRHFQIVAPDMGWIQFVKIVNELPSTERGDGGFGSTGK